MLLPEAATYQARSVQDWLRMASRGSIALPTFQRSYVWDNQRIADYLLALFENRPTGIFLVLADDEATMFSSRRLKNVGSTTEGTNELLLDGQQRLTSLWMSLTSKTSRSFYVCVKDLSERDMDVEEVVFYSDRVKTGKSLKVPSTAYKQNLVPIDILWDRSVESVSTTDDDDPGMIWKWCKKACSNDEEAARRLENAIKERLRQKLLLERSLHYCILPPKTERAVAIEIFVQTNKSSANISTFDIVVAEAQGEYGEDFRHRITGFFESSQVVGHYFSRDDQVYIRQIGEWILKVACLKIDDSDHPNGLPPKEKYFESSLQTLFSKCKEDDRTNDADEEHMRIDDLQEDLESALTFVAERGGATERTLPAWPPVHVIAALQEDVNAIRDPAYRSLADGLMSAYLWRSFLTERYEAQANDRLFEDFVRLRGCVRNIKTYSQNDLPVIFDETDYPIPDADGLKKSVQWIGRGRFGPAIAAAVMQQSPLDWVTGKKLDYGAIRDLEDRRKLNRHHIFPRDVLKSKFPSDMVNHGLNGVLLSKEGNLALGRKAPNEYLLKILGKLENEKKKEEKEKIDMATRFRSEKGRVLRKRIESHLVPFELLIADGKLELRYEKFLRVRASRLAKEIRRLVTP